MQQKLIVGIIVIAVVVFGYLYLRRSPASESLRTSGGEALEAVNPVPADVETEPATTSSVEVSGMPETAVENFFKLLGAGKTHEAYLAQSKEAQAEDTEEAFAASAKETGFTTFKSGKWTPGDKTETEATVSGTITMKDGKTLPLFIVLLAEDGAWKIRSVGAAQ